MALHSETASGGPSCRPTTCPGRSRSRSPAPNTAVPQSAWPSPRRPWTAPTTSSSSSNWPTRAHWPSKPCGPTTRNAHWASPETPLGQSQPGVTVTLCLVLVTPHDRRLHIAKAGHIPPLLIDPDHGPRFHHPHGPLLGMGLPHPPPTVLPAPPGTRLLLVTDGLVEVRTAHPDTTLAEFSDAVAEDPHEHEELRDLLLARFGQNKDDDIALTAGLFTWTATLPAHPRSAFTRKVPRVGRCRAT
ncbi:PP2C family protein-serine/threonine phosphatase [Streptomyces sp. NPDC001100]